MTTQDRPYCVIVDECYYSDKLRAAIHDVVDRMAGLRDGCGLERYQAIPSDARVTQLHSGMWATLVPVPGGEEMCIHHSGRQASADPPEQIELWWRITIESGSKIVATSRAYGRVGSDNKENPPWLTSKPLGLLPEEVVEFLPTSAFTKVSTSIPRYEDDEEGPVYQARSRMGFKSEVAEWRRRLVIELLSS